MRGLSSLSYFYFYVFESAYLPERTLFFENPCLKLIMTDFLLSLMLSYDLCSLNKGGSEVWLFDLNAFFGVFLRLLDWVFMSFGANG